MRGAGLLVVAVVLGIVLLHSSGDPYSRALRATSPGRISPVTTVPIPTTVTFPLRAPAEIKVLPANGTGTAAAAGRTGDKLKAAGYNVLSATNTSKPVGSSSVEFKPGFEREARVLATLLALPDAVVEAMPTPPLVPDTRDADIVVIVGPDLAGKSTTVTSPPTTVRRTTVTTARTTPTTAHTATTAAHPATTKKP